MSAASSAFVVGLSGVTNGGKTTMCRALDRRFSSEPHNLRVRTMHLDDYFRSPDDPHHVHLDEFNHHDWDSLHALKTDQFLADLHALRAQCDLLLVEGFLIVNVAIAANERHLYDLAYFFDLPYEECLRRRLGRNYNPPDPKGYFEGHVWQAFGKAKEQALGYFDDTTQMPIVNTMEESYTAVEERLVGDIERGLAKRRSNITDSKS